MQDQPTAAELLRAVNDFLRERVLPQLEGHAAFHGRVAANVLDIVQRELETAPAANAAEHARLGRLLGEEGSLEDLNRALCRRIRSGELGLDTPGLVDHLWETTLTKVAIDQPKYATYQRMKIDRSASPE
ncbi:MAG: hypothetical protein IID08_09320 [Candidatus Hydrogenedentes bacterium]|nr:hypothetical protein [Candidatus Hydrogenedentota bacterium]